LYRISDNGVMERIDKREEIDKKENSHFQKPTLLESQILVGRMNT